MGAWWLFAGETRAHRVGLSPDDDMDLVAAFLDGATSEPPRDVLVAGSAVAHGGDANGAEANGGEANGGEANGGEANGGELYLALASDRTVIAVAKKGGAPRVLAHLEQPAQGMALAGGALWVTTSRAVEKIPVAGGELEVLAGKLARPRAVASDGRWVFVVDVDPSRRGLTQASAVVRVPATGGATGGEPVVLGHSDGEIPDLALDDGNVYWADRLAGSIVSVPKTGGAPRVLASERGLPGSIAVEGDALLWVEKRSESLWTMPKAGGAPRRLAQDFAGFANVVVDEKGVFWTNEAAVDGAFRVLTVDASGDVHPLSPAVDGVDAMVSDGARLFWERRGAVTVVPAM
jgi:hypothetical protein